MLATTTTVSSGEAARFPELVADLPSAASCRNADLERVRETLDQAAGMADETLLDALHRWLVGSVSLREAFLRYGRTGSIR